MCSLFFIKFLFFTKWQPFKSYEKCFLFHLKSSFRSRDNQIVVFLSSPLFLPGSHCFRGWSKKNLEIYDVIKYLNKNLITHFVWYLEKEIRCDIESLSINRVLYKESLSIDTVLYKESLSIDTVLYKELFYEKIMHKMCIEN